MEEWTVPPADLRLNAHEVHVWRASLDQPTAIANWLSQLLSADEQERAQRFRRDRDRLHFAVGRGILRVILSAYLDSAPEHLQFDYGTRGKPELVEACNGLALRFNVSHSQGLALYAVVRQQRVGVDLEQIRPIADLEQLVRRFFSTREHAEFLALPAEQQPSAFFQGWTCKEAYLKAIGQGLVALEQVEVSLAPAQSVRFLQIAPAAEGLNNWSLYGLNPAPNYKAALAIEGALEQILCWDWWPHEPFYSTTRSD